MRFASRYFKFVLYKIQNFPFALPPNVLIFFYQSFVCESIYFSVYFLQSNSNRSINAHGINIKRKNTFIKLYTQQVQAYAILLGTSKQFHLISSPRHIHFAQRRRSNIFPQVFPYSTTILAPCYSPAIDFNLTAGCIIYTRHVSLSSLPLFSNIYI